MPSRAPIAASSRISLATTAISTTIPGEAVILDTASGRYFGLEAVGARVWTLLRNPTTLSAMIRTIMSEFDVDEVTCERDLRALLDDLAARGLVVVGDEGV